MPCHLQEVAHLKNNQNRMKHFEFVLFIVLGFILLYIGYAMIGAK